MIDALGASWNLTRNSAWPVAAMLLVIFVPAGLVGLGLHQLILPLAPIAAMAILYVLMFSAVALSWLAGVAVYSLARPGPDHLAEVFA